MKKVLFSWSSGKDSAWALHLMRTQYDDVEVLGLLTTINSDAKRVAMHAVREHLLEMQADALGLPLRKVFLPHPCSNEVYECMMKEAMEAVITEGFTHVAFGDLFLEDIRSYREEKMQHMDLALLFPLWKRPTAVLAREMLEGGLKAVTTCVDPKQLDPCFVGRSYDEGFLADLPATVDPCGENGEFHTFVYGGPMFRQDIPITIGEIVDRGGFRFADYLPQ